jgi:hypothetical protein
MKWPLMMGALGFSACAEGPSNMPDDFGYEGTGIEFQVAPLTLDSLSDACYSFAVVNEDNELVVGRGPGVANSGALNSTLSGTALETICASQFGNGNGGDVSYVAPCDADSDDDNDGLAEHNVILWVDALCASGTPVTNGTPNWDTATAPAPNSLSTICNEIQPYQNPCGSAGCSLPVTCVENADTPVTFNFTIMGQADQGFFDIAVNFDDIFCSAKLDSCYNEEELGDDGFEPDMIQMLFDNRPTLGGFTCEHLPGCDADGQKLPLNLPEHHDIIGNGDTSQNCTPCTFDVCIDTDSTNTTGTGTCIEYNIPDWFDPDPAAPWYAFGESSGAPNPDYQERMNSIVLAVACTTGPIDDASEDPVSEIRANKIVVRCAEGNWSLDVSDTVLTQEGNQDQGVPFPWAAYFGNEFLPNVDKVYLNVVLGLEGLSNCVISWEATVIDSSNPPDFSDPAVYNSYPSIVFATKPQITDADGNTRCQENPVNGVSSTVYTKYNATQLQAGVRDVQTGTSAGLTNQVAQVNIREGNQVRYLLPAIQQVGAEVTAGGVLLQEAEVNVATLEALDANQVNQVFEKTRFRNADLLKLDLTDESFKDLPYQLAPIVTSDFLYARATKAFSSKLLNNWLDLVKAADINTAP